MPKPELGWISRVKLFESERPKPVRRSQYENVQLPEPPVVKDLNDLPPVVKDSLAKTKGRVL